MYSKLSCEVCCVVLCCILCFNLCIVIINLFNIFHHHDIIRNITIRHQGLHYKLIIFII